MAIFKGLFFCGLAFFFSALYFPACFAEQAAPLTLQLRVLVYGNTHGVFLPCPT